MSAVTQAQVEAALQGYNIPHLNKNPMVAGALKSVAVDNDQVSVSLELGFPAASIKVQMQKQLIELLIKNFGSKNPGFG